MKRILIVNENTDIEEENFLVSALSLFLAVFLSGCTTTPRKTGQAECSESQSASLAKCVNTCKEFGLSLHTVPRTIYRTDKKLTTRTTKLNKGNHKATTCTYKKKKSVYKYI